jgi:hypothetical protein
LAGCNLKPKLPNRALAFLKYLTKYVLTANVSAYANTFVCQKYVAHANVWIYFTYAETFVVNAYYFKYFKYAKG